MNRSKAKGTAFESDLIRYLQSNGYPDAERRALSGVLDKGDVAGVAGWVLEAKNHREMDLATWIAEAQREAINAKTWRYAVVHKRRGKGIRDAYVTLPLWLFVSILSGRPEAEEEVA